MKKRLIGGLILFAIVLPVFLIGGIVFDIAVLLLACGAFKELVDINKNVKIPNIMKIIAFICIALLVFVNVDSASLIFGLSYQTISIVFLLLLMPTVFLTKYKYSVHDAFYLAAITLFLGTVFNLFIMLFNESKELFIWIVVISCATDIFALFGGLLIGKHKFTKISPNKTIEGCVVGSLVGTIIGVTYYVTLINSINIVSITLFTLLLSIIGQIGDLFFSLIKRENGVKDYSNLIPGHGGILDRIDSIIFILIAFVFAMQFL